MRKITKDMNIGDAIKINPKVAEILIKNGLHCVGCAIANMETIEQGAKAHGLSDKDIKKIIEEINK